MTRSLVSAQRDASKRVAEARRFSIRLPLVGTVRVPPPDQLVFYGVLSGLAVLEIIDWPVALAMGIGSAVVSRHLADLEKREEALEATASGAAAARAVAAPAMPVPPAQQMPTKAPAKKAVKKAPAKKTVAQKTPAKKAVPQKTPAKKAPVKRPRA